MAANKRIGNIPLGEKMNLTVEEAAVYTGIGQQILRSWMKEPDCKFVLRLSPQKSLLRRKELEDFIRSKDVFYEE